MPLPDFITFTDKGDGTGTIRLAPGFGDRGDHAVRLMAFDDGGADGIVRGEVYTFIVTVESDNEPPQFAPQRDVVALIGAPLELVLDIADMDQDALSVALEGLPSGAVLTMDPLIY